MTDLQQPEARPPDVDTGFWLWAGALVLFVAGYVIDLVTAPVEPRPWFVDAISGVFVTIVAAVVATFLLLMRQGYRWARALLSGGGATSVFYVVTDLLGSDRPPVAAMLYAVSTILGSVMIIGGIYLLHRKDVQAYFGGR